LASRAASLATDVGGRHKLLGFAGADGTPLIDGGE